MYNRPFYGRSSDVWLWRTILCQIIDWYVRDNVQLAGHCCEINAFRMRSASPCRGLFQNNDRLAVHYPLHIHWNNPSAPLLSLLLGDGEGGMAG